MHQEISARVEPLPTQTPKFEIERCLVVTLGPDKARELLAVLLQDELLAAQLPWMVEKSADGARKEAFLIGLECTAETTLVWGIVEWARGACIGAVIARSAIEGLDVDVLCASQFWNRGIGDEAWPIGWKSTLRWIWCWRVEDSPMVHEDHGQARSVKIADLTTQWEKVR